MVLALDFDHLHLPRTLQVVETLFEPIFGSFKDRRVHKPIEPAIEVSKL